MKKMKVSFLNKSKMDLRSKYLLEDNLMDVAEKQFLKQQEQLFDLQNNLRLFIKGIINVTDTMDNMYSCFKSIYEPNWVGNIDFNKICQESIKILRQFIADFKCNISKAVNEYGQEFPEIRRSIEKRNKKLSELSKQRRIYENYRNSKKLDETKIKKAKTELDYIDQDYQNQNNTLKESLPKFCDKRISTYVDLWTKLFDAEGAMFYFLHESRKNQLTVLSKLSEIKDNEQYSIKTQINLVNDHDKNLLSTKAYAKSAMSLFDSDSQTSIKSSMERKSSNFNIIYENESLNNGLVKDDATLSRTRSYQINGPLEKSGTTQTSFFTAPPEKVSLVKRISFNDNSENVTKSMEKSKMINQKYINARSTTDNITSSNVVNKSPKRKSLDNHERDNKKDVFRTNPNNSNDRSMDNLGQYKVMALFDYISQDGDELTLSESDVILVLPWNNEKDMEEGWLFGENVITKKKGIFPENHTTKVA